jgi:hypothetical protein
LLRNANGFADKPHYHPGMYACIATSLLNIVIVLLVTFMSWRQNKRADRGEVELEYNDVSVIELCEDSFSWADKMQENDQKGFRYTY